MKNWLAPVLLGCLAATVVFVFLHHPSQTADLAAQPPGVTNSTTDSRTAAAPNNTAAPPPTNALPQPFTPAADLVRTQAPPATVPPLPPDLVNIAPLTALENMRTTFRQYTAMFGGNPVGTNPEITRSLMGDNLKHINFLKADGNRVNSNGEMVDVWGTPYFFHQLSGTVMEIRSAGPDRVMWTEDDLVIR